MTYGRKMIKGIEPFLSLLMVCGLNNISCISHSVQTFYFVLYTFFEILAPVYDISEDLYIHVH